MGSVRSIGWLLLAVSACSSGSGAGARDPREADDAGPPAVRARFELGDAPMAFGAVPWPDDAYLDADGRISVRNIPSGSAEYADAFETAMGDLDGFGVRPVIYVRFDGELDAKSLPQSPDESLDSASAVFLVDADTSSAEAFARIPVDVIYRQDAGELRIRPAHGRGLVPGRRYAAVVTNRLRGANGKPVAPAKDFAAIRDGSEIESASARAARGRYIPVLQTLATLGTSRRSVVALSVFHVQTVQSDLELARELVHERPLPLSAFSLVEAGPALDAVLGTPEPDAKGLDLGAPHDHVGFLVHGSVAVPSLSAADDETHGVFERGPADQLLIRGEEDVTFSLWLPRGIMTGVRLPVVVVQHDLGRERSDAAALANVLAQAGFAVIAADLPYHGERSGMPDLRSRFTGHARSDGFGDRAGDFVGTYDSKGPLVPMHPFYFRDAMRQAAVDAMALLRVIREGDWSEIETLSPALEGVELDVEHVGFVGIGLGASVGAIIAPFEPDVNGFVLAFGGGSGIDGFLQSPARAPTARALLAILGGDPDAVGSDDPPAFWPDVDAWRTLSDRGNPLAYAWAVRRAPANVLALLARDDEVVDNASTEALAFALGATAVGGAPRHELALSIDVLRPAQTVSANFRVETGDVTRVLFIVDPATHDALMLEHGLQVYEHPVVAPFVKLEESEPVENPVDALTTQIGFWFGSVRACTTVAGAAPCAASFQAPAVP